MPDPGSVTIDFNTADIRDALPYADLHSLRRAIRGIVDLHSTDSADNCNADGELAPCPTVRMLAAELGVILSPRGDDIHA